MKKTSQNDVTGDWLQSKPNSDMFNKNYDQIDFSVKLETPVEKTLAESIEENVEIYKKLSRIDVVGQNGNEGIHYEYQLNKSTGEVEKVEDGSTPNTQK